jgi:DNA uptake protein ComE-like DNA-binding protein
LWNFKMAKWLRNLWSFGKATEEIVPKSVSGSLARDRLKVMLQKDQPTDALARATQPNMSGLDMTQPLMKGVDLQPPLMSEIDVSQPKMSVDINLPPILQKPVVDTSGLRQEGWVKTMQLDLSLATEQSKSKAAKSSAKEAKEKPQEKAEEKTEKEKTVKKSKAAPEVVEAKPKPAGSSKPASPNTATTTTTSTTTTNPATPITQATATPLSELPGIGPKTLSALEFHKIFTVSQLVGLPPTRLQEIKSHTNRPIPKIQHLQQIAIELEKLLSKP